MLYSDKLYSLMDGVVAIFDSRRCIK